MLSRCAPKRWSPSSPLRTTPRPTPHTTHQALIHALLDFKGGLLVISHDEHLVSSICGELWVAEPGRVAVYKDSFELWRERERKRGPTTGPGAAKVPAARGGGSKTKGKT